MDKVRIAIAEDHPHLAQSLKANLELSPEFEVVHWASDGTALLAELHKGLDVDLVLMDINMPKMDGLTTTERLKHRWPEVQVVMSTVYDDEDNLFYAIRAGAVGYLLKDQPPEELHQAIRDAMKGGVPMSPEIARKSLNLIRYSDSGRRPAEDFGLTPREKEVLDQLSKGLSYDQTGEALHISTGTVRKHVENVYRKLNVSNKVEAIKKYTSA